MAHSSTTRRSRHAPAKRQQCSLYSSPAALSTLPVYEDITVTWDPACLTILPAKVDLFLSVQEPQGLTAVHVWTGIDYAMGKLDTQLSPAWWGDSIGAGSVSAQVSLGLAREERELMVACSSPSLPPVLLSGTRLPLLALPSPSPTTERTCGLHPGSEPS